jgi:flagellar biosynthetic protein FliP
MYHRLKHSVRAPVLLCVAGLLALFGAGGQAFAQESEIGGLIRDLSSQFGNVAPGSDDGASLSGRLIQLFVLITALSVAPGLLVVMTSFTRFVIVFSMLRLALGLNQTPPNIVLNAMALFMTLFVMQPVFEDAWEGGVQPLLSNAITEEQAIRNISEPFYNFMLVNTRDKDIQLFTDIAGETSAGGEDVSSEPSWRVMVPSFMISELRRAFTIGFLIYLPFVAIDLIVASILMSAGMMMLPPVLVSLPFKVIFFVLIDGWYMLAGSLIQSYLTG